MKNSLKALVVGTGVVIVGGALPVVVNADAADSQPAVEPNPPATTQPQPAPASQPSPPTVILGVRG